jgi:hypothetical protein
MNDQQGFVQSIWKQVFRDELVLGTDRFLSSNFFIGLFSIVVLLASAEHPERSNALLIVAITITVATHVAGWPATTLAPERAKLVLLVQGLSLFTSALVLTGTALWLAYAAERLTSFRYLPGMMITLFTYAALEIHFFGPERWRRLGVRRLGVLIGLTGELALAGLLLWRLLRHTH